MDNPNLDDLASRPRRYWTIDGLPELTVGVIWIIWGSAWLVGSRLPHDWHTAVYWLIVAPALALMVIATKTIIRRLKEQITFPRTGYVQWRTSRPASLRVGVAIGVAVALLAAVTTSVTGGDVSLERTMPRAIIIGVPLGLVAVGIRQRTPHHLTLAAAAVVLALAIGTLATGWDAMNWFFLALGATCTVVGVIRLSRFVRANPLPNGERP